MVTYTTTYNLKKPTVADDEDVWGGYLNDSMDLIDDVLDGTTPVTGIDINSGTIGGVTIDGNLSFGDNTQAIFGADSDFIIQWNETNGTFNITSSTSKNVGITTGGSALIGSSGAQAQFNGAVTTISGNTSISLSGTTISTTTGTGGVTLDYDGSDKIATSSTGVSVSGNITVSGTVDGRDVSADGAKLDGIESGATADQTKADIDALGINAATLDSLDSTQFLRSDATDTVTGTIYYNDGPYFYGTSYWRVSSSDAALQRADARDESTNYSRLHWYGQTDAGSTSNFRHAWYDGSAYINVTATSGGVDFTGSATHMTIGGNTVWHSGNDGVGSGLDADLLDGQHGSYYTNAGNLTGTIGDVFSSTTRYNIGYIDGASSSNRDKLRVWNSSSYTIGMSDGYTFGGLNNNYAMSFQMNDDNDRGFWWGDTTHTNAQGAMSLTTSGRLTVAEGVRIGYGQTDTTIPSNQTLAVNGSVTASSVTGTSYVYSTGYIQAPTMYLDGAMYHTGDTNTYIQFHAADQWRVVTGGSERLEVNNTRTQIDRLLVTQGLHEDYEALSGTTPTCDVDLGGGFSLTMTGNTTFTFGAMGIGSGSTGGFVLELTGNGSTVTWPTSVVWAGGTAPDAPASGETDLYVFYTRDNGTTWYGVQSIDAAA